MIVLYSATFWIDDSMHLAISESEFPLDVSLNFLEHKKLYSPPSSSEDQYSIAQEVPALQLGQFLNSHRLSDFDQMVHL